MAGPEMNRPSIPLPVSYGGGWDVSVSLTPPCEFWDTGHGEDFLVQLLTFFSFFLS
jgi:hypothetical protein